MLALSTLQAQDGNPLPLPSEAYAEKTIKRQDFDEKKWESLKEGIDYGGTKKPKEKKKKEKKEDPKGQVDPSSSTFELASLFKFLAILGGVALLIFLIVRMISGDNPFGPKNAKLKATVSASELEKIEENLHEAELEDPIRRAIAAGDYPMAVRLYYLSVLKELAVRKHIRWKRDKTNGAYLRELAGAPLFSTVQEVTLAFERVWYGKVELTKQDFDRLEITLKQAVAKVSA